MYFSSPLTDFVEPFVISNKAVAHGAVLLHVDHDNHKIAVRVARATYGIIRSPPVNANDKEHTRRKFLWETDTTGQFYVPDYFEAKFYKVGPFLSAARELLT